MQGFIKLAEGIDILPLKMAVERQLSVFEEEEGKATLFDAAGWQGQFFAFPQIRNILLDIMRRVECGQLREVELLDIAKAQPLGPLLDSQQCFVVLALGECILTGAGTLRPGDVVWANGVVPLVFRAPEEGGFALVVTFDPIP